MNKHWTPLAALALLAACGQNSDKSAPAPDAGQREYQTKLREMPDTARNAVFIRAIRDAGFTCQHVSTSSYLGDAAGAPTWSAKCDESEWTVAIGPGGSAQVTKKAPTP